MPLSTPGSVADSAVTFSDITTNDSSTTKHGFLKKLDGTSTHYMDGSGSWSTPAGSGEPDPVADILGTPDTTFEFDSSSLTGLTGFGTPDTEDADTTIPGAYYIMDNDNTWTGRYASATPPFTVVTKMIDKTFVTVDGYKAGLFIGDSAPAFAGDCDVILQGNVGNLVYVEDAGVANITSTAYYAAPIYFAIRVNSSTDSDFLFSANGRVWYKIVDSRNVGYTVAVCGLVINGPSAPMAAAFDYLRIWNSAKSFPGALA